MFSCLFRSDAQTLSAGPYHKGQGVYGPHASSEFLCDVVEVSNSSGRLGHLPWGKGEQDRIL